MSNESNGDVEIRDAIDQALSSDREIDPSPWFRRNVMRRIRAEAELPPIRFPWRRFATGSGLALVAVVVSMTGDGAAASLADLSLILPAAVLLLVVSRFTTGRSTSSAG